MSKDGQHLPSDVHSEKENGEAGVESGGWSDSDEKGKEKSGREGRGGRGGDGRRTETEQKIEVHVT